MPANVTHERDEPWPQRGTPNGWRDFCTDPDVPVTRGVPRLSAAEAEAEERAWLAEQTREQRRDRRRRQRARTAVKRGRA